MRPGTHETARPRTVPRWLFVTGVAATFVAGVVLPVVGIAAGAWLYGW